MFDGLASPPKSRRLVYLIAIAPSLCSLWVIWQFSVNVPLLDEWVIARLLPQVQEGTATWFEWFRQFNEHRILIPRLIIVTIAQLSGWNLRWESLVTWGLTALIGLGLCQLERSRNGLVLVITHLLIFSFAQWENWLIGLYLKYLIPIACLVWGLWLTQKKLNLWLKAAAAGILSTIATFSIANGLLLWLLLFPNLFPTWAKLKQAKSVAIAWALGFMLHLYWYFGDYRSPYAAFDWFYPLTHLPEVAHYLLVFLGAPWAFGTSLPPLAIATLVGLVLGSGFTLAIFKLWQSPHLWQPSLPWLTIALYSLTSGLVVAIGRIYSGVDQALTSRYSTFALYFMVGLLHLGALLWQSALQPWLKRLIGCGLGISLVLHLQTAIAATQIMTNLHTERLQGKACLQAINLLELEPCIQAHINPKPAMVKQRANRLAQAGFLPLLPTPVVAPSPPSPAHGQVEQWQQISDRTYKVSGWAVLPHRHRPADALFLTYTNSQGEHILFDLISPKLPRPDIAQAIGSAYLKCGWEKLIHLPHRSGQISAWSYDTEQLRFYLIANGQTLLELMQR
ncbi:MAG: hypothetical protein SFT94_00225 [Pseudanabaenaceae cyanobacterium bins.68]|nr:hypothetical protein [Pseudanabaenaceae cyanobacterium bins.68]